MNPIRKTALGAALLGATLAGGAFGAAFLGGSANAQSDSSSSSSAPGDSSSSSATNPAPAPGRPAHDPSKGGHMANGVTEELLTGDTAAKVTAAARAAVPGGTIERVETDAEGSPYEAHATKADGSHVTVKVGSDFTVTGVEEDGHR
jgi:cellulase/cellobiase CelA1